MRPWPFQTHRRWLGLLMGAGLLLAGVGAWRLLRGDTRVVVAINTWPGYEYFYLAEQKGLDRPYGLDLRLQEFSSLEDQRAAYVRGDVEVIATTVPEAIAICQEMPGRCPELILVLDQSDGADVLFSRREIPNVRDLAGQRVGLERTVLAEYLLLRALETEGLSWSQVRPLYDGPDGLVAAFQRGDLAAIVTYAPYANALREESGVRVLFSSAQIPGEVVDVLAVHPAYARRHARQLRGLVRTWWAAQALVKAEPAASRALMAARQQMSPREFLASERWIRYPGPGEQDRMLAPQGPVAQVVSRTAEQMVAARRIQPDAPLPKPTRAFLGQP